MQARCSHLPDKNGTKPALHKASKEITPIVFSTALLLVFYREKELSKLIFRVYTVCNMNIRVYKLISLINRAYKSDQCCSCKLFSIHINFAMYNLYII